MIQKDFGLNNTSYVQWIQGGKQYRIDTSKLITNITVKLFENGIYSVNAAMSGRAKAQ